MGTVSHLHNSLFVLKSVAHRAVSKVHAEAMEAIFIASLWESAVNPPPLSRRVIEDRLLSDGVVVDTLECVDVDSDHKLLEFPAAVRADH